MSDWLTVRVLLTAHGDVTLPGWAPGRIVLVHADHTFAELSDALDAVFGRWDLPQLHVFEVEGRRLSPGGASTEPDAEDSEEVAVGEVGLRAGARFTYTFDLGERWLHDCLVERSAVDPFETVGEEPDTPVAVFGWGMVPDQYGRLAEDDEGGEQDGTGTELDDDGDDAQDAALLAAWDAAERDAWAVVERALAGVARPRDPDGLRAAVAALRAHEDNDDWPYDVLWAAGGLDDGDLPEDDAELWLALAAGVVEPRDALPLDPEIEAAWAAMEPADWAGAVIELVRRGPGQSAEPEILVGLIGDCPEIEGEDLTADDTEVIVAGLDTVVALWQALGAVSDDGRLTPLGAWGLPEALRVAWTGGEV